MAPYLLILFFAAVGFFVKGVVGLVVGAVIGYFASLIIGTTLFKKSKGLVPYKERLVIAQDMIKNDKETVEAYSEQKDVNSVAEFIANDIQQLFLESSNINKGPNNYWLSYPVITGMIKSRVDESSGVEKKYNQLLLSSIKLMYPAHRNQ